MTDDPIYDGINARLHGNLSRDEYYDALNSLSGAPDAPYGVRSEIRKYWIFRDPSNASEETRDYLSRCLSTFAQYVGRRGGNGREAR